MTVTDPGTGPVPVVQAHHDDRPVVVRRSEAEAVGDPGRLAAVRATGLLDAVEVESLDHLTRLAARLLDAPLAFLTVVDDRRSHWASCAGVTDGTRGGTVEESFCRYVITDGAPLVVEDAATHPRTRDNPSVVGMGVRAWAGYPVLDTAGRALGSFCVVDTVPRAWTPAQVEVLGVLAEAASAHLTVLTRAHDRLRATEVLDQLRAVSDGLSRMASVALRLGAVETTDELAEVVVEHGLPALGAQGGVVAVRDDAAGVLRLLRGTGPIPPGREVVALDDPLPMATVARTGEMSLLRPAQVQAAVADTDEPMRAWAGDGTWGCAAMRAGERLLGSVSATWAPGLEVSDRETGLLQVFTALCAQTFERIENAAEQRRAARVVRTMSETLQRSLLTQPPVHGDVRVAVRYVPAAKDAQVGGDWYDAFLTDHGALTLAIGDISGHDQMAAAAMGQVRNLLRGLAWDSLDGPARVLSRLDAALRGLQLDTLATALVARVEQDEAARAGGRYRLRWSSAGHLPPLLRSPDGSVQVLGGAADLMLGVDATAPRAEEVLDLRAGATVLLYTDGLVERRGTSLDTCIAELRDRFERVGAGTPEEVCDALLAGVHDDEHRDDLAMLVVRFDG